MTVDLGLFVQPDYSKTLPFGTLAQNDPAFSAILREVSGQVGVQQSLGWIPKIIHAFYSWKGYMGPITNTKLTTPNPLADGSLPTNNVRYTLYDDGNTQATVTNKAAAGGVATLATSLPHGYQIGEGIFVGGVTSASGVTFTGYWVVTAVPTATTLQYSGVVNAVVASTAATGTLKPGYWDVTTSQFLGFTNVVDTTGTSGTTGNTNNLGPRRFADFVRAAYGSTPLITWRSGAMDSTHNMENQASYQKEFLVNNVGPGRTDTATAGSGVSVIADVTITQHDYGMLVVDATGAGMIPAYSYVGAVTPGVSFTLVNANGTTIPTTGTITSITIGGAQDTYIKAFAAQVADHIFQYPALQIQIRLDQEMNGNNYPWGYNNQWINPTTPANGPFLCNALTQLATTGSPVAAYGGYANMYRHVRQLFMSTVVAHLQQAHAMSSGAATTRSGNIKWVWCVGSGNTFPPLSTGPLDGNQTKSSRPFVEVGTSVVTSGQSSGQAVTQVVVTSDGTNATAVATVTPPSPQQGCCFPVGSQVTFASVGSPVDGVRTVTSMTNTTVNFALPGVTTSSTLTPSAGTADLVCSTYVDNMAPWVSYYPGDDVVDIMSMDGYNASHLGPNWKNVNTIFNNNASSCYPSLTGFSSKPIQISECACIENPSVGTYQTLTDAVIGGTSGAYTLTSATYTFNKSPDQGAVVVLPATAFTGGTVDIEIYIQSVTSGTANLVVPSGLSLNSGAVGSPVNLNYPTSADWVQVSLNSSSNHSLVALMTAVTSFVYFDHTSLKNSQTITGILATSLVSGASATSIDVYGLTGAPKSGDIIQIQQGTAIDSVTLSANGSQGGTPTSPVTLSCTSFIVNSAYTAGIAGVTDNQAFNGTYALRQLSNPAKFANWAALGADTSHFNVVGTLPSFPSPALTTVPTQILVKQGTKAVATTNGTIPALGEPFFFTDTNQGGIGDGMTLATAIPTLTSWNRVVKSSAYTAYSMDIVLGTGTFPVTSPAATANARVRIKNTGTGIITFIPASGTVDGAASFVISTQYAAYEFLCDGTNWDVF